MLRRREERSRARPRRAAFPGVPGRDRPRPEPMARAAGGHRRVRVCQPVRGGEHVLGCVRASVRVPARAASELARVWARARRPPGARLAPQPGRAPPSFGAPPALSCGLRAAERARLGRCDLIVPFLPVFLVPTRGVDGTERDVEDGSRRGVELGLAGHKGAAARGREDARRGRPPGARRGGPSRFPQLGRSFPDSKAQARLGIGTSRGGAPGRALSSWRAPLGAEAPAPRRLPTTGGPAGEPRAPSPRRGARPDQGRKNREPGREGKKR